MLKNGRFGRTRIEANELATNCLVLNGNRFTSDDLLSRQTPPVLVQPQPTAVAPAAPAADDQRLTSLEQALATTRASIELSRSVHLERTAIKRKGHWYVAGKRVNAGVLQGDNRRYFVNERHSTIAEALQSLAAEIDAINGAGLRASDESSNSNTN